jgi:hypothetical protein
VVAGKGDEIVNPLHEANYDAHCAALAINVHVLAIAGNTVRPLDVLRAIEVWVFRLGFASDLIAAYAIFHWAVAKFICETPTLAPGSRIPSASIASMFEVQRQNTRHVSRIWLVVLLQRNGIKEESAAISRHGGQPRS